jgi:hypothetical protein
MLTSPVASDSAVHLEGLEARLAKIQRHTIPPLCRIGISSADFFGRYTAIASEPSATRIGAVASTRVPVPDPD